MTMGALKMLDSFERFLAENRPGWTGFAYQEHRREDSVLLDVHVSINDHYEHMAVIGCNGIVTIVTEE